MCSICCNAETKIGYYNIDQRPDIHGIQLINSEIAVGVIGTYCTKCGKLCDYVSKTVEYFTNGTIKK